MYVCKFGIYSVSYQPNASEYIHTYIISRPFPFGVGRDRFLPLATILTNTFRFFHCHQIPHTRSPVSGTSDLAFLQCIGIRRNSKGIVRLDNKTRWRTDKITNAKRRYITFFKGYYLFVVQFKECTHISVMLFLTRSLHLTPS
jgi:hypothetical protein